MTMGGCVICAQPCVSFVHRKGRPRKARAAKTDVPCSSHTWSHLAEGTSLPFSFPDDKESAICKICWKLLESYQHLIDEWSKIEKKLASLKIRVISRIRSGDKNQVDTSEGSLDAVVKHNPEDANPSNPEGDAFEHEGESDFGDIQPHDVVEVETKPIYDEVDEKGLIELPPPELPGSASSRKKKLGRPLAVHVKRKRRRLKKRLPMKLCCTVCPVSCSSSFELRRHMIGVHKQCYYQCPACEGQFTSLRLMVVHVHEHESKGEWLRCRKDGCAEGFPSYRELCDHRLKYHRQKFAAGNFACKYCQEAFATLRSRREHYNEQHREERPHVCEVCGDCFDSRKECSRHVSLHRRRAAEEASRIRQEGGECVKAVQEPPGEALGEELKFECGVCGVRFPSREARKRHVDSHDSTCPICGKRLSNTQGLMYHMPQHNPSLKLSCGVCGILCATKQSLDKHVARHENVIKYQCDTCGKFYNNQNSLESHIRSTHDTQEAFRCPHCGRLYGRLSDLKSHISSVHEGNKSHVCRVCGECFKYSSALARHRFSRHERIKYTCQICAKSFTTWNNRYAHMYTHTNTKPYECRECGVGFPRKPPCVAHIRSYHAEAASGHPEKLVVHHPPDLPEEVLRVKGEIIPGVLPKGALPKAEAEDLTEESVEVVQEVPRFVTLTLAPTPAYVETTFLSIRLHSTNN